MEGVLDNSAKIELNSAQCQAISEHIRDELEFSIDRHLYKTEKEFKWLTGCIWFAETVISVMMKEPAMTADEVIFGLQCYLSGSLRRTNELVSFAMMEGDRLLQMFNYI